MGDLSELAPRSPRENPALRRVGIVCARLGALGILQQLVSYKPPTEFLHSPVTQTKTAFSKLTQRQIKGLSTNLAGSVSVILGGGVAITAVWVASGCFTIQGSLRSWGRMRHSGQAVIRLSLWSLSVAPCLPESTECVGVRGGEAPTEGI